MRLSQSILAMHVSVVAAIAGGWHCGVPAQETIEFQRDVLPILSDNCFACHGPDASARQSGLRLDLAEAAFEPADSGQVAIAARDPEQSPLIQRVESNDESERMPPLESGKSLSEKQKLILRRWVAEGAVYQKHWSLEVPQAISPPEVGADAVDAAGPTAAAEQGDLHPIDRFIQAQLHEHQLAPSPLAENETLLRRLNLDLIGMPPTVEELDVFLAEAEVDRRAAYLRAVERLLESPHYGERWARWWLDQARYADSNGYSIDAPRQIWKYRDWVIAALNSDMPFDKFTIEQLAGDLLPDATQSQKIATGFHRNTQINQEGGIDKEQFRVDSVFDRVATTSTVWLGLTVGCAQCHDHKFDPIPQVDYYRLFAFFNSQDEPTLEVYSASDARPELADQLKSAEQELDALIEARRADYEAWESRLTEEEKGKLSEEFQQALAMPLQERSPEQKRQLFGIEVGKIDSDFQTLLQRVEKLTGQVRGLATTLVMSELEHPRTTNVFIKGDFTRPAEAVMPGTPAILHPLEAVGEYPNRLDLARWIMHPDNPLTARVIVNRVWQVYFGRGLVETENDFGTLGTPPSHPELLDWLAIEFRDRGWSLKELHRMIVTSNTYQQSSDVREDLSEVDPGNYLLGRQSRLRLEAEIVRDIALAACGLLSAEIGGPPVYPPIPDGVMSQGQIKRTWSTSEGSDRYRRGIYTFVYRATPPPSLSVFDAPDGFSTCTRRARSNTPLQALTLLNDSAYFEFAEALAQIIHRDGLEDAFRRCTSRAPQDDELAVLRSLDALSAARVLLNLDETITRE